ncbi:ATP-binding cassette domain-containing protein [Nocardia sp.]|uniref:ABC transporter permease subunit n=1 Tax=Nocardia sp. TaxID=1821 RepID=UPI0025853219|nr:ATP-binding cassette domain-containing protein [Nocardia sp.]
MTQHPAFLLLGLGNGAVFGALALAVVLTYRSSGVVNFASGSIALYGAYTYAFLRQGKFLVLVPGLPTSLDLGGELAMWPAVIAATAISALLGLALYVVVFRPLRTAPAVAKAVAALGISLVITGLVALRLGTSPVNVDPIFSTTVWQAGGVNISSDRVYFAATVLTIAIAIALIFRYTRFGLATRAAAETEQGAYVSGISPDRIAAYNWMLSSAAAGLAGVLIATIVPLVPVAYTLFIVPALAAAIVARFESVVVAVVAGIVIGALQSEAGYLQLTSDWLPSAGLPELVPLILILVVLLIRARPLPNRGAIILRSLGRAPRPNHVALTTAVTTLAMVAAILATHDRYRNGLITTMIMAIIALSIVVVTGYAGQVSLAQSTIAGVAAFSVGPITTSWHLPFPLAPIVAALLATALGVVIGLPALRIRGLTVAVVTLAMAYALEALWFRNLDLVGTSGVSTPAPTLFGWDLGIGAGHDYPRPQFALLCLAVLIATAVAVALLRRSGLGSQMLAVRANERSAAAAGVNVVSVKILAFAIAAFIAGLGGALLAYQQQTVTASGFGALDGLIFFGTVYLAGVTSISGGTVAGITATGGILYSAIDEVVAVDSWYTVIASLLLVLTVIVNPEGIVGPVHAALAGRRAHGIAEVGRSSDTGVSPVSSSSAVIDSATPTALALGKVGVHYGGVVAVDNADVAVPEGAIVGIIGPNGAGKTTLIDAITGFATHSGEVTLFGDHIAKLAPHQRVRAGLGRTFQATELYDDLSVSENIKVGLTARGSGHPEPAAEHLDTLLRLLTLDSVRNRTAGELSQGQRQLVSIARALAGSPRVLLLDEPAGGLDTHESQWLGTQLRGIRDSGVTIAIVDHDTHLLFGLCDLIYVLDFGRVIASGTPVEIRNNPVVAAAYLGSVAADATLSKG